MNWGKAGRKRDWKEAGGSLSTNSPSEKAMTESGDRKICPVRRRGRRRTKKRGGGGTRRGGRRELGLNMSISLNHSSDCSIVFLFLG